MNGGLITLPASEQNSSLWDQIWWLLWHYYNDRRGFDGTVNTWLISAMADEAVKRVQ